LAEISHLLPVTPVPKVPAIGHNEKGGTDRGARARASRTQGRVFDRMDAANAKVKLRERPMLEKRINSTLKKGAELVKAAKGLGKA